MYAAAHAAAVVLMLLKVSQVVLSREKVTQVVFSREKIMETFTVDQVMDVLRKEGSPEKILDTLAKSDY